MTAARDDALGLAAFLVASARDTLEAPPVYGAFRLVDAAARLTDVVEADGFLTGLKADVEAHKGLVMADREAFVEWLDGLLARVAAEVKARNLAGPAPGQATPPRAASASSSVNVNRTSSR